MKNRLCDIVEMNPGADTLWDGSHKIPWNDPLFSARILREHLSQDHHLASRKSRIIADQVQWIQVHCLGDTSATILDLGCGPGLYSLGLSSEINRYRGLDFSPASIQYAQETYGMLGRREFFLGDVTRSKFFGSNDLVMMLYGELNVFSPAQCNLILRKAWDALKPGGRMLVELQNPATVQFVGQAPKTWTRAPKGGLFSDAPYVCLTENYWFEKEQVSLQYFHVMEGNNEEVMTYRSTTRAWSMDIMQHMLYTVGFDGFVIHDDWPIPDDGLALVSVVKS